MIGLGLALAQPNRRVLVMTGDGEMLMGMGSLASVTAQRPDNLSIAIFDNARFGETGAQRSHTAYSTDLGAVAAACGWRRHRAGLNWPSSRWRLGGSRCSRW